jgi:predicted O-linked N-acetylglucosamine transferase (SPINDLY family)
LDAERVETIVAEARRMVAIQDAQEGERLDRAVEMLRPVLGEITERARPSAFRVLWRAGCYEAAASLGDLRALGRWSARHGRPDDLLFQLPRIASETDRLEVVEQHRLLGERLERRAAAAPIVRPPRGRGGGPIRLGFLSSDLRHHVVAYFAQPLWEYADPRFALYGYSSFRGEPDVVQQWIAGRSAGFRILPEDDREAAGLMAADELDLLIDLGGTAPGSRPGVLAFRPAPLQASWLGYPHSLGLPVIDHIILDPFLAPERRELLLEAPLLMPQSWIAMSGAAFQPQPPLQPEPPFRHCGRVTFGTANDPYKFNPPMLRAWARIVAAAPGSRFMIVRPEAGAQVFRDNIAGIFALEGVTAERLDFRPVRGAVRAAYGEIDIALDTFPVTGGTTTCEAFWMGAPTVTLAGPAIYERLGWSILNNLGLADLAAPDVAAYERTAVALADDPARLAELRRTARQRVASHPIGQARAFAACFYDLVAGAIGAAAQAR